MKTMHVFMFVLVGISLLSGFSPGQQLMVTIEEVQFQSAVHSANRMGTLPKGAVILVRCDDYDRCWLFDATDVYLPRISLKPFQWFKSLYHII